ncbi:hypothetical protein [Pseudonocardia nigra]|uniref:hypothetical protein n=1 Tax=Pseudonocardia nigra TaxID=1921578 RepID=UPI001FE4296F|nr:hypothetical protein [Pseudonocardia nigra]
MRALSTRAHITPTSFVNTYEWGDFRGNPRTLMKRYYDAFLYLANWGTRRLMFRVPARLLDLPTAARYCAGESASAWASGEDVVIELVSDDEEGGDDLDWGGEGWLSLIVPVRAEVLAGDRQLLYLAWLLCVQNGEVLDEEVEPPVPSGLGRPSASLSSVVEFLRIDPDLLAVAADSPGAPEPSEADMASWIANLPVAEKDAVLLALLRGTDPNLRAELLHRFRGAVPPREGHRTARELLAAADARWTERARVVDERRREAAAEQERLRVAARERRLAGLAADVDRAWTRVAALIATRKPAEYDQAVDLLSDLRDVTDPEEFGRRIRELRAEHGRKPSLMERFDFADLP